MPAMTQEQLKEKLGPFINEAAESKFKELMASTLPNIVKEAISEVTMKNQDSVMAKALAGGAPLPTKNVEWGSAEDKRGVKFGQVVRAVASAKYDGGGFDLAMKYLNLWGEDKIAKQMEDAREKTMQSGTPTAGGFLVPEEFSQEVIEYLRPMSVVRNSNPMIVPMMSGTMRIPRIDVGSSASYIGETVDIPKTELETGQITLQWKKLAALVPISNDLLRFAAPSADTLVRDDVSRAMAEAENRAFLRGRGSDAAPKGLRYWAAQKNLNASDGDTNQLVNETLGKLILRLKESNIPMTRPVWMMAPKTEIFLTTLQNSNGFYVFRDEMMRGTLWNIPYKTSTIVPVNLGSGGNHSELYLVDMADACIGESLAMRVDVSNEATYVEGSSTRSTFSRDETAIRVIAEHDFVMRRNESVAVVTDINWGN